MTQHIKNHIAYLAMIFVAIPGTLKLIFLLCSICGVRDFEPYMHFTYSELVISSIWAIFAVNCMGVVSKWGYNLIKRINDVKFH